MTDYTLSAAALEIVKAEVSSFKADGKRYEAYVTEMQVTLDTVADHVAIFREAFKAARGNKDVTSDEVKAFATKVRNGLNRQLGKSTETAASVALITKLGAESELDAVIAAWHAAQA